MNHTHFVFNSTYMKPSFWLQNVSEDYYPQSGVCVRVYVCVCVCNDLEEYVFSNPPWDTLLETQISLVYKENQWYMLVSSRIFYIVKHV